MLSYSPASPTFARDSNVIFQDDVGQDLPKALLFRKYIYATFDFQQSGMDHTPDKFE